MTLASTPQPDPIQTSGSLSVLTFVLADPETGPIHADLSERATDGVKKYGVPLMTCNGRDALADFYQETLDAVMYARQHDLEEGSAWTRALYEDAVRLAKRVRQRIDAR